MNGETVVSQVVLLELTSVNTDGVAVVAPDLDVLAFNLRLSTHLHKLVVKDLVQLLNELLRALTLRRGVGAARPQHGCRGSLERRGGLVVN